MAEGGRRGGAGRRPPAAGPRRERAAAAPHREAGAQHDHVVLLIHGGARCLGGLSAGAEANRALRGGRGSARKWSRRREGTAPGGAGPGHLRPAHAPANHSQIRHAIGWRGRHSRGGSDARASGAATVVGARRACAVPWPPLRARRAQGGSVYMGGAPKFGGAPSFMGFPIWGISV